MPLNARKDSDNQLSQLFKKLLKEKKIKKKRKEKRAPIPQLCNQLA